jgi:hypothetical protein
MQNGIGLRSGFNRKRVFPVLKTTDNTALLTKNITVLALLTGAGQGSLDADEQSLAGQYLGTTASSTVIGTNTYVNGIAVVSPVMVEEHDPNRLEIAKICNYKNEKINYHKRSPFRGNVIQCTN